MTNHRDERQVLAIAHSRDRARFKPGSHRQTRLVWRRAMLQSWMETQA